MTFRMKKNKEGSHPSLSFPSAGGVSSAEVWKWYRNIPAELDWGGFTKAEREGFREYYREAGLLRTWRRSFFRHHFARSFAAAAGFLMEASAKPTILDLGCGCGTQSLFLAAKGARVIALDSDPRALSVLEKRRRFYERKLGRTLDLTVCCVNVFDFDFEAVAPIQGLFSLFAFNLMQPTGQLLKLIEPHLDLTARVAIVDGNNRSWLVRLIPSRRRKICSPPELRKEFESRGFAVQEHCGGIVFPPLTWNLLPPGWLCRLDEGLGRNWLFPISQRILAVRNGS